MSGFSDGLGAIGRAVGGRSVPSGAGAEIELADGVMAWRGGAASGPTVDDRPERFRSSLVASALCAVYVVAETERFRGDCMVMGGPRAALAFSATAPAGVPAVDAEGADVPPPNNPIRVPPRFTVSRLLDLFALASASSDFSILGTGVRSVGGGFRGDFCGDVDRVSVGTGVEAEARSDSGGSAVSLRVSGKVVEDDAGGGCVAEETVAGWDGGNDADSCSSDVFGISLVITD